MFGLRLRPEGRAELFEGWSFLHGAHDMPFSEFCNSHSFRNRNGLPPTMGQMRKIPLNRIVSENLSTLMAHKEGASTVAEVAKLARVGVGTVQRIKRQQVSCAIDTLEAIARVFDLEAWQLLIPHLDPANPPALRSLSDSEAELYQRLRALLDKQPPLKN